MHKKLVSQAQWYNASHRQHQNNKRQEMTSNVDPNREKVHLDSGRSSTGNQESMDRKRDVPLPDTTERRCGPRCRMHRVSVPAHDRLAHRRCNWSPQMHRLPDCSALEHPVASLDWRICTMSRHAIRRSKESCAMQACKERAATAFPRLAQGFHPPAVIRSGPLCMADGRLVFLSPFRQIR